jgi:hypothetical protein
MLAPISQCVKGYYFFVSIIRHRDRSSGGERETVVRLLRAGQIGGNLCAKAQSESSYLKIPENLRLTHAYKLVKQKTLTFYA